MAAAGGDFKRADLRAFTVLFKGEGGAVGQVGDAQRVDAQGLAKRQIQGNGMGGGGQEAQLRWRTVGGTFALHADHAIRDGEVRRHGGVQCAQQTAEPARFRVGFV